MTAPRLRKSRRAWYGANRCSAEYRVGSWRFWKPRDAGRAWLGSNGRRTREFDGIKGVREFARRAA